jgi:hypothetical protein
VRSAPVVAEVAPRPDALPASGDVAADEAAAAPILRSARSHRSGKHYFELVIDEARAGALAANVLARVSNGRRWTGASYAIQARDLTLRLGPDSQVVIVGGNLGEVRVPKIIMGFAADLDTGWLYRHRDGIWVDGATPGSAHGAPLTREGLFSAEAISSLPIAELVDRGIVKLNFGAEPFERTPPPGYRGFDWPDHLAALPAPPATLSSYPSGRRIAGDTQVSWVRRYWEWVRSFSAAESPSADATGQRCAAGQSGPVWFLTGSRESRPVRRECDVPQGKVLLVPIINALVQANTAEVPCDRLLVSLRQFSGGTSDLRFSLNGKALDNPQATFFGTGCFKLRDASAGQTGLAAGSGYWVFLPPLPRGRHVVEFGGKAIDGFQQDVGYVLHIR